MKLTPTQVWIFLQQLGLAGAAIAAEIMADPQLLNLFPTKYAHAIAIVALIGLKIRAMTNLKINPDGTPATQAYRPLTFPPEKKP